MITRWGLAFMLIGMLVAGLLYDRVAPLSAEVDDAETDRLVVSPSVADPPRLDVAWYCPVGSSSAGGYADHTVNIANLDDESAVANLTVITDSGPGPRRRLELPPLSTQRIRLADIQTADVAGAVVEVIGGRGAVGHTVTTANGVAEGPCATEASSTWHFASGRTTADAQEYLVLMNPFPETAVFDVTFQSVARTRKPGALQAAFVEARSIRVIDVNDVASGDEVLAAKITTNRGRLVVERLQLLDGQLGATGAALQLGVPTPARSWMFTAGRVQADGDDLLTIYNPNEFDLTADQLAAAADQADAGVDETNGESELAADGDAGDGTEGDGPDEATADGTTPGDADEPLSPLLEEDGTTTVAIELWPSNPSDLSTYSVVTIEREVRPGNLVTIDLRAQAERFEFPLPYELGVFVTSNEGVPIVAERWQFADRLISDLGTAVAGTGTETGPGDAPADGTDGLVPGLQAAEAPPANDLPQPIATEGVSTSRGHELFSTRWVIPWVTMVGDSTLIAISSADEAAIEIRSLAVLGQWDGPLRATVPAGGRVIVPITSGTGGAAVEVVSDTPVSVEAMVVLPDQSLDVVPGVPTVAG
ncbi:MAG: DUF5719 family protein [Actinomycetota bacterium]